MILVDSRKHNSFLHVTKINKYSFYTLYHIFFLPFSIMKLPDLFKGLRTAITRHSSSSSYTQSRVQGATQSLAWESSSVDIGELMHADSVYEWVLRMNISAILSASTSSTVSLENRNLLSGLRKLGRLVTLNPKHAQALPTEIIVAKVDALRRASEIAVTLMESIWNDTELTKKLTQIQALVSMRDSWI